MGLDSGEPRCRRKTVRTTSEPTDRNSLCQFCIDWNQKSRCEQEAQGRHGRQAIGDALAVVLRGAADDVQRERQGKEREQGERSECSYTTRDRATRTDRPRCAGALPVRLRGRPPHPRPGPWTRASPSGTGTRSGTRARPSGGTRSPSSRRWPPRSDRCRGSRTRSTAGWPSLAALQIDLESGDDLAGQEQDEQPEHDDAQAVVAPDPSHPTPRSVVAVLIVVALRLARARVLGELIRTADLVRDTDGRPAGVPSVVRIESGQAAGAVAMTTAKSASRAAS